MQSSAVNTCVAVPLLSSRHSCIIQYQGDLKCPVFLFKSFWMTLQLQDGWGGGRCIEWHIQEEKKPNWYEEHFGNNSNAKLGGVFLIPDWSSFKITRGGGGTVWKYRPNMFPSLLAPIPLKLENLSIKKRSASWKCKKNRGGHPHVIVTERRAQFQPV